MADPSSSPADGSDAERDRSASDADPAASEAVSPPESDRASAASAPADVDGDADANVEADEGDAGDPDVDALREEVEQKYDFENFGPADMAEMSAAEWEAAFDPDSWITGAELLNRVETDLRRRVAGREVFAVVERVSGDADAATSAEAETAADVATDANVDRIVAYSDEGYAVVYPDGSVEGEGTVLRDVKPTVALCSMDEYEVEEAPADASLPRPEDVVEGSGELGNLMLQIVGTAQVLAGLGLLFAWLFTDLSTIFAPVVGGIFVSAGIFFFLVVANARLSDRFRAEAFRDRLRAAGVEDRDPPDYLPVDDRRRAGDEEGSADPETGSDGA